MFAGVFFITFSADFHALEDLSKKELKNYSNKNYAKHCFDYERTLTSEVSKRSSSITA